MTNLSPCSRKPTPSRIATIYSSLICFQCQLLRQWSEWFWVPTAHWCYTKNSHCRASYQVWHQGSSGASREAGWPWSTWHASWPASWTHSLTELMTLIQKGPAPLKWHRDITHIAHWAQAVARQQLAFNPLNLLATENNEHWRHKRVNNRTMHRREYSHFENFLS